jgi:opacity protein-like surface antigen
MPNIRSFLAFCSMAMVLTVCAAVAQSTDEQVSGKWDIARNAGGQESTQTCTLTQKSSEITGTCSSDAGPLNITGKVDGKKVTWTYKTERDGSPLTVIYTGTLHSATKMTGTVSAVEFGIDGEFTAIRGTK